MNFDTSSQLTLIKSSKIRDLFAFEVSVSNDLRGSIYTTFLKNKFDPDGFNVGINCGKSAGQTVMHMHIHLIPRYKGDVEQHAGGIRGVIPSMQKY